MRSEIFLLRQYGAKPDRAVRNYGGDEDFYLSCLQKFLSEADESKANDSHAAASVRIRAEFADTNQTEISCIRARALELFRADTKEMQEKYGKQKPVFDD